MTRFRLSLPVAILSALSLVLLVTWFLLGVVSLKTTERSLYSQKSDEARLLITALTRLLPENIATTRESPVVVSFIATLARDHEFHSLVITDSSGGVVFAAPSAAEPDRLMAVTLLKRQPHTVISTRHDTITRYAPIITDGSLRGVVRLTLTLAEENDLLDDFRKIFLAYFILDFLLLLGLGSFLLSRLIVVPVRKLLTATHHIGAGNFSYRVPVSGTVETAELAQSFNSMAESLATQRTEIENHVISLESANEELKQAREETIRTEKMASVGLLAAGMAHEVGTPLAAIMGYAGILRQELQGDPERLEYAQRIEDDARRIDHIVRHLLDYARPRSGELSRVDVGDLIREVFELLKAQGLFKKIRVTCDIPDDLPEVKVDGHQLQQVLINLMINARDALVSEGDLHITASEDVFATPLTLNSTEPEVVRGRRKSDFRGAFRSLLRDGERPLRCLKIEVRDTGEGIPREHLERLFDPFFTTKEPGKGTGLGLAICARIIDSFNGRITVQSTEGVGTIFCVWLPVESE
jgi:two-component system NtrC family sensor kinase